MNRMTYRLFIVAALLASPLARADEPGAGEAKPADEAKPVDAPAAPAATDTAPTKEAAPGDVPKEAAEPAKTPEEAAADAAKAEATAVVTKFLEAVKAKKWDVAKRYIHPKTIEAIADMKKRKGVEDHRMALWAKVGENYMTAFELSDPTETAKGGLVVVSSESVFSVEDKGTEDGVHVAYLVLPLGGKMWVVDRKVNGENDYPANTLPAAYKGYFEGEYKGAVPSQDEPAATGKKKK